MRRIPLLMSILACSVSHSARADRAAGDACAAGLPSHSQQIYSATVALKPTPEAARSVVVAETKKMIRAGALSPLKARSAESGGSLSCDDHEITAKPPKVIRQLEVEQFHGRRKTTGRLPIVCSASIPSAMGIASRKRQSPQRSE